MPDGGDHHARLFVMELKYYLGLSEWTAVQLAALNNIQALVVERDGCAIFRKPSYSSTRVSLTVVNDTVIKAVHG